MKSSFIFLLVHVLLFVSSSSFAGNKVEFVLKKDIKLVLIMATFDKSKHRVKRCGKESICLIDGLPFFGSDGRLPKTQLTSMVLTLNGKKMPLDVSGMYEPWNFYKGVNYISKANFSIQHSWGNTWILRGRFSDGAAGYRAQWLISEGKSIRTMLNSGESLAGFCLSFK